VTGNAGARGLLALSLGLPAGWLLLFFLLPMGAVWLYGFGWGDGGFDLAAYARALDPVYLGILLKSLATAAAVTLICLAVGLPVAVAIGFAPASWKPWLLLALMLPFWTNLLIRTYALIAILRTEGLANKVLGLVGFGPLELMNNGAAVVVGLVYVHLPFMVLPIYAALDRLDRSLVEASLDLGASHLRTMFAVVLPLALPGIASGLLITFVPALGSYLTPDLLGGPDSQMIANVIERQFKRADDWAFGSALSFLLVYLTFAGLAVRAVWSARREARA